MTTKLTIKDIQKIALKRGGWCLSKRYITSHSKLFFQCGEEHVWAAMPYAIRNGTWCPICSQGVSERICRAYFESIFDKEFPKRKPNWLISESGGRMELDGFCEELGLAFEYNGEYHYKNIHFSTIDAKLERRKRMDKLKLELCKENNVELICIPYSINHENIQEYIINSCMRRNIPIPKGYKIINYRDLNVYSFKFLEEMKRLAKKRGGECLSSEYVDSRVKLEWQCKEGHVWIASPHDIKQGRWCPECASNKKGNIEELQEIALDKGGWLLSIEYINRDTTLWWQCGKGHIWKTIPEGIKNGTWCPYCYGNAKLSLEDISKYAKKHHGKCLSNKYINNRTKLEFECEYGHRWFTTPNIIRRNHWCPICRKN